MITTDTHFDIPDNSDSSKYFDEHHMALQDESGEPIFSFWDDDDADYVMYCCKGREWSQSNAISGYNPGGNKINVAMVLTADSDGNYGLVSRAVQAGV